ncbi:MAG: ABC-type nitrate/sulfonate/bicarbonate transport system, ATPase component [Firmicutes bacterium]|nr:ABC-type nitrate/sulfonate/bicarbonate transport system, ATPase component [Bacillota bacterium]
MYIEVKNVSREYTQKGTTFKALDKVNLNIARGEFICLLGPSGCGKTTLLNSLAGFEQVTEGSIKIDGAEVKEPSIKNVTIFQNYGLLPWRTVQKNVELGLESKGMAKQEIQDIADKYIDIVGLTAFKKHHPYQLSGGMQQRVAIARALAVDPDIIFMDEPFGALDALTRMKMQDEISAICKNQQKTIIFVTHDIDESVFLADRIVIMTPNPGKIKTIVKVDLCGTRDRTSTDFLKVRDWVFAEFEMKEKDQIDYFI